MLAKTIRRRDFPQTGGRAPLYPYEQIIATLGTSRAVFLPAEGKRVGVVISSVTKTLRRRGYRPRVRLEKGGLAVWVEREG